MARRKRKHTKRHHSRRRHHGMGAAASTAMDIVGVVAGAVIGKFAQSKLSSRVNPKILAGSQIAVGLLLPRFVKSPLVKNIGVGMIANGGVTALSEFGVLSGIGMDEPMTEYIGGSEDIATIAGDDDMMSGSEDIQTIAGIDDEIGAFEDEMYS